MNEQARLLADLIDEQKKTNQILLMLSQSITALVEALADEHDPDQEPRTYLNGQPLS